MKLDALDLMQGFRREITLTAERAAYHRHMFYYQQALTFSVTARHMADACAFLPANITYHFISLVKQIHRYNIQLSVGLSLVTTVVHNVLRCALLHYGILLCSKTIPP